MGNISTWIKNDKNNWNLIMKLNNLHLDEIRLKKVWFVVLQIFSTFFHWLVLLFNFPSMTLLDFEWIRVFFQETWISMEKKEKLSPIHTQEWWSLIFKALLFEQLLVQDKNNDKKKLKQNCSKWKRKWAGNFQQSVRDQINDTKRRNHK